MDIRKNTVSATNQVRKNNFTEIFNNGGKIKVLFIGNSITRHEPKPEIGWNHDWGMAATYLEKDYVHVALHLMEEKFGKVNYCITNCGNWEQNYWNDAILDEWKLARDFQADIVILRVGENIRMKSDENGVIPLAPHYRKMVHYFCANPNAKVIITGLFWRNDEIENFIKRVAEEEGYPYIRLNDLGVNDENMAIGKFEHQGVAMHPNDLGMKRIAERIVAIL